MVLPRVRADTERKPVAKVPNFIKWWSAYDAARQTATPRSAQRASKIPAKTSSQKRDRSREGHVYPFERAQDATQTRVLPMMARLSDRP